MGDTELAHVHRNLDGTWAEPHHLLDHLAEEFARPFASEAWARACGYGHDTGKGSPEWQRYLASKSGYGDESAHLETCPGKLEHSSSSAKLAEEVFGKSIGRILSYCIAGHHAGLPDWLGDQSSLAYRLQRAGIDTIPESYREQLVSVNPLSPPRQFALKGLDLLFWILPSPIEHTNFIYNHFGKL